MNENTMTVKFWGVRGSYPTPGPDTVLVGGNTACVEVRAGGHTIILDAGTGIILLGRDLMRRTGQEKKPVNATLVFSHMHHDHTQGFPFFVPAFVPTTRLHIFGPHTFEQDLEQVLARNMVPPVFPVTLQDMSASKFIRAVGESQNIIVDGGLPAIFPAASELPVPDAIRIRMLKSHAHPGGSTVYRIEWNGLSVVYATDTEGYANTDRRLVDFARGADLLIHDAQYTESHYLGLDGYRSTQGWGHSTAAMACDVARTAGAKKLALFHFDPTYDDDSIARIESDASRNFGGVFAAREGLELILSAAPLPQPVRQFQALAQAAA